MARSVDVLKKIRDLEIENQELKATIARKERELKLAHAVIDEASNCPKCKSQGVKNVCLDCSEDWGY